MSKPRLAIVARVDEAEKRQVEATAAAQGLSAAAWVRAVVLREVAKQTAKAA